MGLFKVLLLVNVYTESFFALRNDSIQNSDYNIFEVLTGIFSVTR